MLSVEELDLIVYFRFFFVCILSEDPSKFGTLQDGNNLVPSLAPNCRNTLRQLSAFSYSTFLSLLMKFYSGTTHLLCTVREQRGKETPTVGSREQATK
jgi:hypothetical protein